MSYCFRCGRRIPNHARVCPHCGSYTHRHGSRSKFSGILIRLVIIALLVIVFLLIINNK